MYNIAMSTLRGVPVSQSIDIALRSGCRGIEIQMDYLPEERELQDQIICQAKDSGLIVSLHAPSGDINLSALNRGIRRESVRQIAETIALAARHDLRVVTVHPGHLSSVREDTAEKWKVLLDSVSQIAACAKENCVYIGLENMEKRKKELVLTLEDLNCFSYLCNDNPYFGITLDYSHLATNSIFTPDLTALKLPIHNVHMSQCIQDKPHLPLDAIDGQVDMHHALQSLQAAGYTAPVVLEIKSVYDWKIFHNSVTCLLEANSHSGQ